MLEATVRDYIAKHPWLTSPEWETFDFEKSVNNIMHKAADIAGFTATQYDGRIDLVLSSGNHSLVLEFMRPGLQLDWDHIHRLERYVIEIRGATLGLTASQFSVCNRVYSR